MTTPTQNLSACIEEIDRVCVRLNALHTQLASANALAAESVLQGYVKADQLKSELVRLRYLAGNTLGCNVAQEDTAGGEL